MVYGLQCIARYHVRLNVWHCGQPIKRLLEFRPTSTLHSRRNSTMNTDQSEGSCRGQTSTVSLKVMTSISSVAVYEATVAPVYGPAMSSDMCGYTCFLDWVIVSHIALQHKKTPQSLRTTSLRVPTILGKTKTTQNETFIRTTCTIKGQRPI